MNSDIDPKDELIKELQNEIKNLRHKLQEWFDDYQNFIFSVFKILLIITTLWNLLHFDLKSIYIT